MLPSQQPSKKSSSLSLRGNPRKPQIAIEGADDLYREIRIENVLTDENGDKVRLKKGAEVEVTVEAPAEATAPKRDEEGNDDYNDD